jgi:hypothetical protein
LGNFKKSIIQFLKSKQFSLPLLPAIKATGYFFTWKYLIAIASALPFKRGKAHAEAQREGISFWAENNVIGQSQIKVKNYSLSLCVKQKSSH